MYCERLTCVGVGPFVPVRTYVGTYDSEGIDPPSLNLSTIEVIDQTHILTNLPAEKYPPVTHWLVREKSLADIWNRTTIPWLCSS